MVSVLQAMLAEFFDHELSFHVNLVTLCYVILGFAFLADECDDFSGTFFCHIVGILSEQELGCNFLCLRGRQVCYSFC